MTWCHRILVQLCLVATLGCGQSGPKQRLVFQATPLPGATGPIDMETTVRMVKDRVAATKFPKRFSVDAVGASQIEVVVSGATPEELEKIKSYVTATLTLEFAAVAHKAIDDEVAKLAEMADREIIVGGKVRAAWVPVSTSPDGKPRGEFVDGPGSPIVSRDRDEGGKSIKEWLVVYEPGCRVTGDLVQSAHADIEQNGRPCISFVMNTEGSANLSSLTNEMRQGARYRHLAIIIDGQIHSAPILQSPISSRGMITGNFTTEETYELPCCCAPAVFLAN